MLKAFFPNAVKCARRKATSICQLMADLPACRDTATYKPFQFCGILTILELILMQNRSNCKAWRLLFKCLRTWGIHVALVTSLDLTVFCWHFCSLLISMGAVDLSCRIVVLHSVRQQKDSRRSSFLQSQQFSSDAWY